MPENKKNSLSIGLTESAVFLRTNDATGRNRHNDSRPSVLRGLLTLELAKPTKISSIQLELQAKVCTSWPEGIGARRIEISEEHKVFSATSVLFCAGPDSRRPVSIGPGTAGLVDDTDEFSRASTPSVTDAGIPSSSLTNRFVRAARRISADGSIFQRNPHSYVVHDPPIPTYSPSPVSTPSESHAQHLEEFRNALLADLSEARTPLPSEFTHSRDHSVSNRPSMEDVPEDETPFEAPSSPNKSNDGRKRFSLSSVLDTIRSSSPISFRHSFFKFKDSQDQSRGKQKENEKGPISETTPVAPVPTTKERRSSVNKLGDMLWSDSVERNTDMVGWKVFKKGTYTFPISFAIPGHAPPTLDCQYGSVTWRIKARVHRPGAFSPKLSASREIVVVVTPTEEDTECMENIIVERLWDQQMQYLISVSGRSFYIGGTIPISFTMMPFTKVKIYRIAVFLEEHIDYYTQFKRVARTEPANRIILLSLKDDSKEGKCILPLESEVTDAFENSPFHSLVSPDDDVSRIASELMGPGPWTFHQELQLPTSCRTLHFTNRNKRSNITVTHTLKLIIRAQRGDDEAIDERTGKRKLFDIVIQTPVHILSCRCNPDWISLPAYSESLEDPGTFKPQCPCAIKHLERLSSYPGPQLSSRRQSMADRMASSLSQGSDSGASAAETSAVPLTMPSLQNMDAAVRRSTHYERLVSGQISEAGEAPPTYD